MDMDVLMHPVQFSLIYGVQPDRSAVLG